MVLRKESYPRRTSPDQNEIREGIRLQQMARKVISSEADAIEVAVHRMVFESDLNEDEINALIVKERKALEVGMNPKRGELIERLIKKEYTRKPKKQKHLF